MMLLLPVIAFFVIGLFTNNARESVAAVLGFLAAAAVPAGAFALSSPLGQHDIASVAVWFLIGYEFSVGFVIVLGLPAFFALRPFRPGHWWSVAAAGGLLGAGVSVILRLPNRANPSDFIATLPLGVAAALVFWAIWRYGTRRHWSSGAVGQVP